MLGVGLFRSAPYTFRRRQLCFNVSGFIARNAHVSADPTDLDGNRVERGRLLLSELLEGPKVVVNR